MRRDHGSDIDALNEAARCGGLARNEWSFELETLQRHDEWPDGVAPCSPDGILVSNIAQKCIEPQISMAY
jgi:hypothetical protein